MSFEQTQLLDCKLAPPPLRTDLVRRCRLFKRLDEGLKRKVTVLSAPAGFGKTCLLGAWASECASMVHWLSLDELDNDLARFWGYFVRAIASLPADFREEFRASAADQEASLAGLLNQLARLQADVTLVLDDYHRIQSPLVHRCMAYLLENLPVNFHLMIATRSAPPLSLARLRLSEQSLELPARELRFTEAESALFFREKFPLTEAHVKRLTFLAEGWVAGMKMMGLLLEEQTPESIASFEGAHRLLFDYFSEEILTRQSERTRDFLLKTSILERFNAPLCEAVTGRDDAQELLETLERANLFLVPLDEEHTWYRYHRLFSVFLRNRLRLETSSVPLHRLAAAWYEKHSLMEDAIGHAVAASERDVAGRLIEERAKSLLMHSEVAILKGWLRMLPDEWIRSRPALCLIRAWAMVLTDDGESIEAYLTAAEQEAGLRAEATAIRALLASKRSERADELCRQALDGLAKGDFFSRDLVSLTLGEEINRRGALREASEALKETALTAFAAGDRFTTVFAFARLARIKEQSGDLRQGIEYARQAIRIASEGRHHPLTIAGLAYQELGSLHYERNELEHSIHSLRESIRLHKQWNYAEGMLVSSFLLERALRARGEDVGEEREERKRILQRSVGDHLRSLAQRYEAQDALIQRDYAVIETWCPDSSPESLHSELIMAEALMLRGYLTEALPRLMRLFELAGASGRNKLLLDAKILHALLCRQRQETERALSRLEEALSLAEPEGFVRCFVDRGEPMADLLSEALERSRYRDYARMLLVCLGRRGNRSELSERELEVLQCIAGGRTNHQIAEDLCVAVCTVKKHINNLYSKLGVSQRCEALLVAREKGLVR